MKLIGFDFKIFYRAGPENKAADALSRIPMEAQLNMISVPSLLDLEAVEKKVQEDETLKNIFERVIQDPECVPHYVVRHGKLFFKGKLVLPRTSSLIPTILHTFYNSVIRGHLGQLRTYKRIAAELFWEGRVTSKFTLTNAQFASKTKYKPCLQLVCCCPFPFPTEFGKIYQWIS